MIEGAKSNNPVISGRTRKEYYVIMDGYVPVGVCTGKDTAMSCLKSLAGSLRAEPCGKNSYIYSDADGERLITFRVVRRLRMSV